MQRLVAALWERMRRGSWRRWAIGLVSLLILALVGTVWLLLERGTRGAEIATVLGLGAGME